MEFDAVISDMPFGLTDCEWDTPIPLDSFWNMVEPHTKPSANFVLFGCGKFTVDLVNSKRKWYRYDLVWHKSKKVGFLWANKMPMRNHESILVFNRPGCFMSATYNPQKTPGGKVGVKTRNHRSSVYRDKGEYTHISDGTMHPGSVLSFKNETGLHPTQKSLALMEFLVRSYTNETDIVIDPFMGSGTTGVACTNAGRTFIGIERNKKYFGIACERIRKAEEVGRRKE
jgi:site-specific DNA-methyltransferase (adenine-specific)